MPTPMTKDNTMPRLSELADRLARAIQRTGDEIGATEHQRIALRYAEATVRSELAEIARSTGGDGDA